MKKCYYFILFICAIIFPAVANANMIGPEIFKYLIPLAVKSVIIFVLSLVFVETIVIDSIIRILIKPKKIEIKPIISAVFLANLLSTIPGIMILPFTAYFIEPTEFLLVSLSFIITVLIEWEVYYKRLNKSYEGAEGIGLSMFILSLIASLAANTVSYGLIIFYYIYTAL